MPVAKPESSDARIIAHVDMDCFYVQVEQRKRPELRGLPTAVVQYNSYKGGCLIAVGYEARACGVKRFMRGDEAKETCPQLQLVQVPVAHDKADLNTYRDAGSEVVAILARKGRCQRASVDEVYLDLTEAAENMLAESTPQNLETIEDEALKSHVLGLTSEDGVDAKESVRNWLCRNDGDHRDKLLACGALIVAALRTQVLKETEFTCSAGIAHNKMLAKLASGMNKPAQQTIVPSSSVRGLLDSLPIKKMKQLGGKLGSSLQSDLGVDTVGDLLKFSERKLQDHYGINTGTWLWNIARGINGEEVEGRLLPKSHGSGKLFPGPQALKTLASVQSWLNKLCEDLSERLCSDLDKNKRIAQTLSLQATAYKSSDSESDSKFPSRSCPLRYGTAKIQEDALNLFQAGLREYIGLFRVKAQGSQRNEWGITSLSISASKIVTIPSGTCSIMKYFQGKSPSGLLSGKPTENNSQRTVPFPTGSESLSGVNSTDSNLYYPAEKSRTECDPTFMDLDQQEWERNKLANQASSVIPVEGSTYIDQHSNDFSVEREATKDQGCRYVPLEGNTSIIQGPSLLVKEAQDGITWGRSMMSPEGSKSCSGQNQTELVGGFSGKESRNIYSIPSTEQEHGRSTPRGKIRGSQSILRFFGTSNEGCSTQSQTSRELTSSGHYEQGIEAWRYNIDEIDTTVLNELPTEIREEIQAWLQPQKRPKIVKKKSSIANYFLPSRSS